MAVTINGNGTITGIAVGGLPDGIVDNGTMADDAVAIADLAATGTASATTFLRGDNSWQAAGGGYWNQTSSGSFTNVSTVDFTGISVQTRIVLTVTGTTSAGAGLGYILYGRLSTDNGTSWLTTAGDYRTSYAVGDVSAGSFTQFSTDTFFRTGAYSAGEFIFDIYKANSSTEPTAIKLDTYGVHSGPVLVFSKGLITRNANEVNNAIQFYLNGGNITGTYKVLVPN